MVRRRRPPFSRSTVIGVAALTWLVAAPAGGTHAVPNRGPSGAGGGAEVAIAPNSGWRDVLWGGNGPVFNDEGPFTFRSSTPAVVSLTDAFCKGDRFRVFDKGVPVGLTTPPTDDQCATGVFEPDAAFSDPLYSKGSFLVPPGNHAITVQVIVNPLGVGSAFLRVDVCTAFGSATLAGTPGDDVICGTPAADRAAGLGGNDVIFTFGDDDRIDAGDGADRVYAGRGDDRMAGGAGRDLLDGQDGNDQIAGGPALDSAYGGNGVDACIQAETVATCEA